MGWTKRQLIAAAFEEIGLADYVYDLTDDQIQSALRRLDTMVGAWGANGIRIGYPLSSNPDDSNIDADTQVPDFAVEAIITNLAVKIAPSYGKQVSQDTRNAADSTYNNMVNQTAYPIPERQMPQTMPRGQGTKPWRNFNNPYCYRPQEGILAGSDDEIQLE